MRKLNNISSSCNSSSRSSSRRINSSSGGNSNSSKIYFPTFYDFYINFCTHLFIFTFFYFTEKSYILCFCFELSFLSFIYRTFANSLNKRKLSPSFTQMRQNSFLIKCNENILMYADSKSAKYTQERKSQSK